MTLKSIPSASAGIIIMVDGFCLMIVAITAFIIIGKSTLAPWSPTKNLIIRGVYRYTGNPMITGVVAILTGESLVTLSVKLHKE